MKGYLRRLIGSRSNERAVANPQEVERAEWEFYISYLREGMVVFDAGAFIGKLTLLFSHFVREGGQVHAFEANPESFRRLETICEAASIQNVHLNPVALAEKEGDVELNLYDVSHRSWSTRADRPLEQYGIPVKSIGKSRVPATTVDRYCREKGISKVDLLKIDVEGAEYQVLLGAREMLTGGNIACCVFEFGATTFDMGNTPDQIESYLAGLGYSIRNVVSADPIFPGRESALEARYSMLIATHRKGPV